MAKLWPIRFFGNLPLMGDHTTQAPAHQMQPHRHQHTPTRVGYPGIPGSHQGTHCLQRGSKSTQGGGQKNLALATKRGPAPTWGTGFRPNQGPQHSTQPQLPGDALSLARFQPQLQIHTCKEGQAGSQMLGGLGAARGQRSTQRPPVARQWAETQVTSATHLQGPMNPVWGARHGGKVDGGAGLGRGSSQGGGGGTPALRPPARWPPRLRGTAR